MAVYQNHRSLFLGLGLWVLCVFLLGYTTTANSTDENGSPVVEYMTDDERKDLFDRGIKPKKLKLVNRETKPVVTKEEAKEEPSELKSVKKLSECRAFYSQRTTHRILPGQHRLSRGSIEIVKDISVILQDCERTKVIISGHTDSRGNPETNQRLSGLLASAVMDQFIKQA